MFALILNNQVVQIEQEQFPVAGMEWVDCSTEAKVGWFYVNLEFKESLDTLEDRLQKAKTAKLAQLAKNREFKAEKSFVEYSGKPYANSQNARIAINDARQSMTGSSPAVSYFTYPTDEDGNLIAFEREIVQFVKDDFSSLADLIRNNERSLREQEIALIVDINACTTLEEVNAINITFE